MPGATALQRPRRERGEAAQDQQCARHLNSPSREFGAFSISPPPRRATLMPESVANAARLSAVGDGNENQLAVPGLFERPKRRRRGLFNIWRLNLLISVTNDFDRFVR